MKISILLKDRRKLLFALIPATIMLVFMLVIGPDFIGMIKRAIFYQVRHFIAGWKYDIFVSLVFPVFLISCLVPFYSLMIRMFDADRFVDQHLQDYSRQLLKYLNLATVIISFLYFVTWFPNYLFWPWWMDQDHFAVSALSWENGIRPYRDLIDFNFPFPIYFNWIVGKIFGWGRPMVINAIDGLLMLSLAGFLIKWCQYRFQSLTSGLCAALLVIYHYCSLDYSRVMQRDWHVVYCSIISLCLLQLSHFKYKLQLSALLMAIACNTRPYAVLAFPPIFWAIFFTPDLLLEIRKRNLICFACYFLVFTLLLWSPLILSGMFDDFLRTFIAELTKGSYQSNEKTTLGRLIFNQLNRNVTFTALAGLIVLIPVKWKDAETRYLLTTWAIAFGTFLFYMPSCPVRHEYTQIPFEMIAAVSLSIVFGKFLNSVKISPLLKCSIIVFWVYHYFPGWPVYSSFKATNQALVALARWEPIAQKPIGTDHTFASDNTNIFRYRWSDYQNMLAYIRQNTNSTTTVGNFLRSHPFPALNGMTGRLTTWPCGEGIMWLRGVPGSSEAQFAAGLDTQSDSVIVWHDRGENFPIENQFEIIEQKIRQNYEPLIRIGDIDIWVKKK